jgi:hypothetical protein
MAFGPSIDMTRRAAGRFWQARTGDGPIERALWSILAILLAIPIALVMAVFVLFVVGIGLALFLVGKVRRAFGGGRGTSARDGDDGPGSGRENVRVVRRPDAG